MLGRVADREVMEFKKPKNADTITASENIKVDVTGYQFARLIVFVDGTVSGTSPTLDVSLKLSETPDNHYSFELEGIDNTGANKNAITQITATGNGESILYDIRGVRGALLVITVTGTAPSFGDTDIHLVLG